MTIAAKTLATLLLLAPALLADGPPQPGLVSRGRVIRVVDGDTVDFEVRYVVRVRLKDAWAPERRTVLGEKAYDDLQFYALGKPAILHVPTQDASGLDDVFTFGRVVGDLWVEDQNLSAWQVQRGNASTAKGGPLGQ